VPPAIETTVPPAIETTVPPDNTDAPPPIGTEAALPPAHTEAFDHATADWESPPPSIPTNFSPYQRVQFTLQGLLGVGSFGRFFSTSDGSVIDELNTPYGTRAFGGVHVSTLFAGPRFHIGPYVRVAGGKGMRIDKQSAGELRNIEHTHFGAGVSMRFNGQSPYERLQLGGAVDVGFTSLLLMGSSYDDRFSGIFDWEERYLGLEIFPRFEAEVLLFQKANGFKMSVPISIGVNVLPFAFYRAADADERELLDEFGIKFRLFQMQPTIMVGINLGK